MAAQQLAAEFRGRYRILVIEPNSHFSWLFAFPRFASAATGANIQDQVRKAFLPFQPGLFFDEKGGVGSIVQAKVEHVTQISVKLDRNVKLDGCETSEVPFRFLVGFRSEEEIKGSQIILFQNRLISYGAVIVVLSR